MKFDLERYWGPEIFTFFYFERKLSLPIPWSISFQLSEKRWTKNRCAFVFILCMYIISCIAWSVRRELLKLNFSVQRYPRMNEDSAGNQSLNTGPSPRKIMRGGSFGGGGYYSSSSYKDGISANYNSRSFRGGLTRHNQTFNTRSISQLSSASGSIRGTVVIHKIVKKRISNKGTTQGERLQFWWKLQRWKQHDQKLLHTSFHLLKAEGDFSIFRQFFKITDYFSVNLRWRLFWKIRKKPKNQLQRLQHLKTCMGVFVFLCS